VYVFADVVHRSDVNFFLYRSVEFKGEDLTELGLRAGYIAPSRHYEIAAFGRNVLDERVLNGAIDFNNLSGFVNEPATWGIELLARF